MDVEYFSEIVFEKLRENTKGIVIELSNGTQKAFTNEDVKGCSMQDSAFCIEDWCFDINHIVGICYVNPIIDALSVLKDSMEEGRGQ